MEPRGILITIKVSSTDELEDITPFVKNALEQEDNGSTVIERVSVREL